MVQSIIENQPQNIKECYFALHNLCKPMLEAMLIYVKCLPRCDPIYAYKKAVIK